ncbi:hypothetical protein F5884DRAFT_458856 [Xylogone sp. PMI_703]|nr:hypothetical protein F5884DRAFT_458856 [Xylogone sp. PMI_703]
MHPAIRITVHESTNEVWRPRRRLDEPAPGLHCTCTLSHDITTVPYWYSTAEHSTTLHPRTVEYSPPTSSGPTTPPRPPQLPPQLPRTTHLDGADRNRSTLWASRCEVMGLDGLVSCCQRGDLRRRADKCSFISLPDLEFIKPPRPSNGRYQEGEHLPSKLLFLFALGTPQLLTHEQFNWLDNSLRINRNCSNNCSQSLLPAHPAEHLQHSPDASELLTAHTSVARALGSFNAQHSLGCFGSCLIRQISSCFPKLAFSVACQPEGTVGFLILNTQTYSSFFAAMQQLGIATRLRHAPVLDLVNPGAKPPAVTSIEFQ